MSERGLMMGEYFSVDRTEKDLAVLIGEKGQRLEADFSEFDSEPREGMVFFLENGRYIRDEREEQERRKRISRLQNKLLKK